MNNNIRTLPAPQHATVSVILHPDRSWNYVIDAKLRDKPLETLGLLLLTALDIAGQQLR